MQHKTKATKIFTRKESQANVEKSTMRSAKNKNIQLLYILCMYWAAKTCQSREVLERGIKEVLR